MTSKLEIQTLGGLSIKVDGTAVSNFVSRKAEALLVYLACYPRPHARETLAALLWDDLSQQRSLANLSVLLSSLRKQLDAFLDSSRHEIGILEGSDFVVDAVQMAEAVAAVSYRQELTRSTAVHLADAIDLYQGPFLAGFYVRQASGFSEWAILEQERLQQLAVRGMNLLVDFYRTRRQYAQGTDLGLRLVNLDPLREESHRHLMRLWALSGQRHAALEQYQTCRTILDEELGVEPAEETTALWQQIKSGAIDYAADPDLTHFQHNLPAETTSFVGRQRELALIDERLSLPTCRLLTIVGPGGVGKTRLALAAARRQVPHFLDGVWFVPLASLPSSDFLETAVADAIGFSFSGSTDVRKQLLNYLRQKEMLLVLDNFEHLLGENGVTLLQAILEQAPELRLLISSRERLNMQSEWLLQVEGLLCPPEQNAKDVTAYGAVQLFQQRAQQVSPTFQMDRELPQVTDIVALLAGMPLGIELAAANVRYYDCAEIAAGIRESLDFLQTKQRDLPARHRSLRAVIDRSWQTLLPEEQAAFAMLSVFRGQFSPDAAQAVWKTNPALLVALVDKSLLQRNENGRFQMHNILRQYAAEKLADWPDQLYQARGRHGSYFATMLQRRQQALKGGQQIAALEEIQAEIENIRVGWRYAQSLERTTPGLIPLLASALDALYHFYSVRSWFKEGAAILQEAVRWLSPPQNEAERILQARLRARHGWFAFLLGEREAGAAELRQSLTVLQAADHAEDVVFCHNYLGATAYYEHDFAQAQAHLTEALALARREGDVYGEAIGLNMMGVLSLDLADFPQAESYLRDSLALKRKIGDQWGEAFSLEKLGNVEMASAHFAAAERRFQESLAIRRRLGDRRGVALCLHQLGDLARQRGDEKTAVSLYSECVTIFETIGDVQATAAVREKLVLE